VSSRLPHQHSPKPRHPGRQTTPDRRSLPDHQLTEIFRTATTTGDAPDLDGLILRLHLEAACRRAGALVLTKTDLDTEQSLSHLHEKGETDRWQPVSPTLMRALLDHFAQHAEDNILRYRRGRPITTRRYDYLWQRLGKHLPWVAVQQISTHRLRPTTRYSKRAWLVAVIRPRIGRQAAMIAIDSRTPPLKVR
jgi:integrase/recombinase XerC